MKTQLNKFSAIFCLTIFTLNCTIVKSQGIGNYTPLFFDNLIPEWSSVRIDSTIIGHKIINPRDKYAGFDGYSHVYTHHTIESESLISNDYYYRVAWTSYDTDLSGGIIEKINMTNGKTVWKSVFDLRTNNRREFIKKADIYNGKLVLYNIEITDKDIVGIPIPIVFGFKAKGVLKLREYDIETGELLNINQTDTLDTSARILSSDLFNRIQIVRIDESKIKILESVQKDDNGSMLIIDTISTNGIYLNESDTIYSIFKDSDWEDARWSDTYKMIENGDGKLYYMDTYVPGTITQDKPMVTLRSFQNGIELTKLDLNYLNIDNHVDAWQILSVSNSNILIRSVNFDKTVDYIIIDKLGKLMNKFNYSSRNSGDVIPALGPNGSLMFAKTGKQANGKNFIDFYQTDQESFKLISSFSISNPIHVAVPSRLINLDDGDFLLDVMHSEEFGNTTKGRFHTTFRFSPMQIGVVSNINENKNVPQILIYPNPAVDYLIIASDSPYDEVEVTNISGIRIKVFHKNIQNIDISTMPNGIYFCELRNNGKPIAREKFVKIE
jgi:hypothetical protein